MSYLPSLRQLGYFMALAKELNFTRAAEACFVGQSTLSAGLKELEEGLGIRLVERDRQSVSITPAGLEVLERAKAILAASQDLVEYAGASGTQLLQETLNIVTRAGYSISNVSVQIIGNRPRIGARRVEAIAAVSVALGGAPVSILATTTDGMGLTGEGKGIAAIATALVFK